MTSYKIHTLVNNFLLKWMIFLHSVFFFRIWNSQFWSIRSGIRIWSLRNRIWLPKCLIFFVYKYEVQKQSKIRQKQSNNSSKCSMIIGNVCLHTKTTILLEKVPSLQKPAFCQLFVLFIYFSYSFFV